MDNSGLPPIHHFRPLHLKLMMWPLNAAWRSGALPPADLCPERLRGLAEKATGLSEDLSDRAHFEAQLAKLLPALHGEARLTDFGRLVAHGSLLKVMKERLWFDALMQAHPEIDRIELAPPIVVVGSMRSGTTRMQRLLASDPAFTALRLYEAQCPVPDPRGIGSGGSRPDPRIRQVRRALGLIRSINPTVFDIHPTGPMEVDEELGLLDQSLSSAMIETQRRVPSFARYCETADQRPAYRRLHRLLKLRTWLEGVDPARPYVLKTPQHMQDIAALHATFPRSPLIFLHRDPVQLVASAASLAWNHMVVQSDEVDAGWIGREWLHKTKHRLEQVAEERRQIPAHLQFDLAFQEVNADWQGAIARTYAFLGRELRPEALAAMRTYVSRAATEHGYARHRYRLEQFGLSEGKVREEFEGMEPARAAA
ncbi:sulfotransferase [Sandaracinobacter sp. RS1-74]|uniref:sulfotransferase family protein n=1 Tax=Sandaracinobacteroides sayramensis TaxID=2913411 RepID=UPI001EDB4DAA|nr:sulfotransferase [Sandaracinobacteroides sayramensis]MCG2840292.1 sulfotransferase [Sandaracinobacteroides sayramensis]